MQVATVLANNPNTESKRCNIKLLILAKAPIASIIPPKTMAHRINQIVPIIFAIPPAVNKSAKATLSVATEVSTVIAFIIPL